MAKKVAFFGIVCNLQVELKGGVMQESEAQGKHEPIIKEIIELQRSYFFEKRNVKTERQRKLKDIIERHTQMMGGSDDS
ncbi:hypothetical protein [Devosia marina]|uniref:Uncharacterized protein n=1 Tax=Devosia marina TaxID=2683198 RepID=A0A7X3K4A5_9HYPH|nr:hypothetical protein [Devosia marina]MVS99785.1 hypothetical protein [Devosia marina]